MIRRLLFFVFCAGIVALPLSAQQISYVAASTSMGAATGTTDPSITIPSGATTNDLLIAHCYVRVPSGDTTTVSEFTQFATGTTTNATHYWFYKRHDGSEANRVCNRSASADAYGRMYAFRNVRTTGDPWDVLGSFEQHGSEPMTVAGITTTVGEAMIVEIDGYADNNTAGATTTATNPSTFTDVYTESATGDDGSVHLAYAIRTGSSGGATGDLTVDYTSQFTGGDESGALVMALYPANPPAATARRVLVAGP